MDEQVLRNEARRATQPLKGENSLESVATPRSRSGIEFTDGTRLIVDQTGGGVELSITVSAEEEKLRSWPRRSLTSRST